MEETPLHKKTNEAQREIDALLARAELWRSYRPVDGMLPAEHAEIDLDVHDRRGDDFESASASIRLFQPKQQNLSEVASVEYEALRVVGKEAFRTGMVLCTEVVRVIHTALSRSATAVSLYARMLEERMSPSHQLAYTNMHARAEELPNMMSDVSSEAQPAPALPVAPETHVEIDDVSDATTRVLATPPVVHVASPVTTPTPPSRSLEPTPKEASTYEPFSRPIARSARASYVRVMSSNKYEALSSNDDNQQKKPYVPTLRPIRSFKAPMPTVEDHATTMPSLTQNDVAHTDLTLPQDIAISEPIAHRTQDRVWRDAWRIVFNELFGGLTQK